MTEYRREMLGSVVIHLFLLGLLWLGESCAPTVHTPKPVSMVTAISMPAKKAAAIPERASQKKRPPQAQPPPTKTPTETAPPPPTKPEQMILKEKEKEKKKEEEKPEKPQKKEKPPPKKEPSTPEKEPVPEPEKDQRDDLLRKLQREQLLKDLNAPEGPVDREASSQEGSESYAEASSSVGPTDPILSAYILSCREALLPHWTPLPTIVASHPEYEVVIRVQVAEDGTMSNPNILKKSGDSSFDRAAVMAVHKAKKLPPPPEKWKDSAASGVVITLAAKDK